MEELPGNPYSFKGADKYFDNLDSKRKAFYDGIRVGKELYTKKRDVVGDCPICYDKIDEGYVNTSCNHTFCYNCFENTICKTGNNCPLCREDLFKIELPTEDKLETIKSAYFDMGYETGSENRADEIAELRLKNNILKSRFNRLKLCHDKLMEEHNKLLRLYKGTVLQLHNTHTLNLHQRYREGRLPRTKSFDSYLKD